jgi:hypothetical protein
MASTKRTANRDLRPLVYSAPSPIHGKGLYARERIPEGSYIGTYWGPAARRDGSHVLWVYEEGRAPEGRRGMNLLRYLNHAERPLAEFDGFDLYALRTIEPGEEITIDYNGAKD